MNLTSIFRKTSAHVMGNSTPWLSIVFSVAFLALLVLAPETAHAQGADVGRKLLGYIMEPFVAFFALLVYAGGVTLNASAYFSIVQMGNLVNGSSGLAVAWDLFRDLGNIVIVFGFIAVGITTILDLGQYNAKRMLATLLIVALLMNFSSLIARGVIDVGNVIGLQFFKAINGNQLPGEDVLSGGISDQFMQAVGLQGIYDAGALYDAYQDRLEDHFFTFSLLIIILFTVTAFVFFSIAFLFIARFVILALLITISPLAFAAMAIPRFNSMTGKWWNALINNTLVAPAVLLMLLVSLKIIQDENLLKMTKGAAWVDTGVGSWAYLVLSFGIVCGFFLASLLIAKQFSAFGASFATNMGAKAVFGGSAKLLGLGLGGGSRLARYGIQNSRLAEKKWARPVSGALRFTEGINFDGRRVAGVGGVLSAVGAGKGAAAGKSSWNDMGLVDKLNVKKKYEDAVAASNKKFDSEMRDIEEGRKKNNLAEELDAHAAAVAATPVGATPPVMTLSADSQKFLSKLSTNEISELQAIKDGNEGLIQNLSSEQFDSLVSDKNDKLTAVEKDKVREKRYTPLRTAVASGVSGDIKKALNNMGKGEREQMPTDLVSDPAILKNLSDKQRDELRDSKHRTSAEKQAVQASSPVESFKTDFRAGGAAKAAAIATMRSNLRAEQIADLGADVLKDPDVVAQFNRGMLSAIEKSKLKPAEIADIAMAIGQSGKPDLIKHITKGQNSIFWS